MMKYVMLKVARGGVTYFYPVIFSELLVHSDVAEAMIKVIGDKCVVHSAGEFDCDDPVCFGSSETLGVESDLFDEARINLCSYGGCIE